MTYRYGKSYRICCTMCGIPVNPRVNFREPTRDGTHTYWCMECTFKKFQSLTRYLQRESPETIHAAIVEGQVPERKDDGVK